MEGIKKIIAFISSLFLFLNAFFMGELKKVDTLFDIPVYEKTVWDGKAIAFNGMNKEISLNGARAEENSDIPSFFFGTDGFTINIKSPAEKVFNYYAIKYSSDANLECVISYSELLGQKSETFFLAKADEATDFYSFIDNYACSGSGVKISSIKFNILDDDLSEANIKIYGIATYMRGKMNETVYISDDNYKLGVCLDWGGSLSYLEVLNQNVQAVRTSSGVIVAKDAKNRYGGTLLTSSVNLINRNDAGRLIQQSYYGTHGDTDSYEPGEFMGNRWAYNPVQGGNKFNGKSKIVDYKINDNSIYIKCRPMDWPKDDSAITPSYMEATYTLTNGVVKCDCRFTDFSKYNHVYNSQEIPAFYCIEPLSSYRYYSGDAPWTNDENITVNNSLIFWPDAGYPRFATTENWSAFTNAEGDFGFGLYVPGNESALAGIADRGGKINNDPSKSGPTSYIAAIKNLQIKNFKAIEYSFLLAAGDLSEIRGAFYENKNIINNDALENY